MNGLEYLSASRINLYLACARKYAFRYIEQAPAESKSANLAFGSAIHSALQAFHEGLRDGHPTEAEKIAGLFASDWAATQLDELTFKEGEDATSLRALGATLIREYVATHQHLQVHAVEQPFRVPLTDPETGEVLGPDLHGFFDLVLEQDIVVEIKTAVRAFDEGTIARHVQVTSYHYAYTQLHSVAPSVKITALLKQRKPRVEEYEAIRTKDDDAWFVHLAAEVAKGIESGIYPPSPGWMCGDCEYRTGCAGWRGPRGAARPAPAGTERVRLPMLHAG